MKYVYVILFFIGLCSLPACKSSKKETLLASHTFYQGIVLPTDTLGIDPTKDTLLTAPKGTKLFLKANSFVLPDGSQPKGPVKLVIKECYSLTDFVQENLSTTSDGKLLSSGGMLYVGATADGKELALAEGQKYLVHFPKDTTEKKPMQLFYGKRDSTGTMNWATDSVSKDSLKPAIDTYGEWHGSTSWPGDSIVYWPSNFADTVKHGRFSQYITQNFPYQDLNISEQNPERYFYVWFTIFGNGKYKIFELEEVFWQQKSRKVTTPSLIRFLNNLPRFSPYPHKGHEADETGAIGVYIAVRHPSVFNTTTDKYFTDLKETFGKEKNRVKEAIQLRYYILESSQLGWINCDYFWNTEAEKADFAVKVDPDAQPNVKLLFPKQNSIMNATLWEDDKMIFSNIPLNQPVKIIAIKFDGTKPLLAIANTQTSKAVFDKLDYKEFTLAELKQQLSK